ncbi:hypothetical protein D3C83_261310 [compost metagenome]
MARPKKNSDMNRYMRTGGMKRARRPARYSLVSSPGRTNSGHRLPKKRESKLNRSPRKSASTLWKPRR